MLKYLIQRCLFILCFALILVGCGEEPEVQVTLSAPKINTSTFTIVRVDALLLKEKPKSDLDNPPFIRMLRQGDQINILEKGNNWSKVQHILSGKIGWLNNSFIQIENRSRWWSGDTDHARQVAERLYKDKIFMQRNWPIIHINIEERWNKLVFTVKENVDFPKKEAIDCAKFALTQLKKSFPSWHDHQVFLESKWNGKRYSLVMGDNEKPLFF